MSVFLLHYAFNALWQVPLLTLTCALAIRLLRPGLLVAHLLWIATLLLAVAMPLAGPQPIAPQVSVMQQMNVPDSSYLETNLPLAAPSASLLRQYVFAIPTRWERPLAALYLVIAAIALLRLLRAAVRARRLVASSRPAAFDVQQVCLLADLAACFGVSPPPVRFPADAHTGPLLTGVSSPVIVLPESLAAVAPAHLAAALAHELAHVRRHDLAVNLALQIVSIPIAFHPASLLLDRRIRQSRELLTDHLAATVLTSPESYAQSLLALSAHLLPQATPPLAAGLFPPFHPHSMEERIMKLIAVPTPKAHLAVRTARLVAATSLFAGALAAASLLHLVPAVEAAQAVAPAPVVNAAPETQISSDGTTSTTTTTVTPTSTTRDTYTTSPDARQLPLPATPTTPDTAASDLSASGASLEVTPTPAPPVPPTPPTPLPQSFVMELPDAGPHPKSFVVAMPNLDAQQLADMTKMQSGMVQMQRDLKAHQGELKNHLDAQTQASLEAMRKQLNSPEFRRQMAAATEAASKVRIDLSAAELNSFAAMKQAEIARAQVPNAQQREALRQSFRQQLDEARRQFREQIRAANGDQALIDKATEQFTQQMQTASASYSKGLLAATPK